MSEAHRLVANLENVLSAFEYDVRVASGEETSASLYERRVEPARRTALNAVHRAVLAALDMRDAKRQAAEARVAELESKLAAAEHRTALRGVDAETWRDNAEHATTRAEKAEARARHLRGALAALLDAVESGLLVEEAFATGERVLALERPTVGPEQNTSGAGVGPERKGGCK